MRKLILFFLFIFLLLFPKKVNAADSNSYVTVINPVRSDTFWRGPKDLENQINLITKNQIKSTWLLQYDVLENSESIKLLKNLDDTQEIGIFLEVSEKLSDDASVPYLFGDGDYFRPDKLLLSGYEIPERKRMLVKIFENFKEKFGYYPKSVGAWYVDSVSLNFLVEKYKIRANLIVSDQYKTDKYGLWGMYWGIPFSPSKFNPLVPSSQSPDTKLDLVTLQWAGRDSVRGYGLEVADSTYSLQANDYVSAHKLGIDYFDHLTKSYLFSPNPINQETIGLEVGQEGVVYADEFQRQISLLKNYEKQGKLQFAKMSQFSEKYREIPKDSIFMISGKDYLDQKETEAFWIFSPFYRAGLIRNKQKLILRDLRIYDDKIPFKDFVEADRETKLYRFIPSCIDELISSNSAEISDKVKNIKVSKTGDGFEMIVETMEEKNNKKIIFLAGELKINDKVVLDAKNKKAPDNFQKLFADNYLKFLLNTPNDFIGGLRFSVIDGKYYIGLMHDKDKLISVSSKTPYFGVFQFPFQVLVRFKTLPIPNLNDYIYSYLTSFTNQCTINL